MKVITLITDGGHIETYKFDQDNLVYLIEAMEKAGIIDHGGVLHCNNWSIPELEDYIMSYTGRCHGNRVNITVVKENLSPKVEIC
jgi:transcriptional regulator of NAD metabolism